MRPEGATRFAGYFRIVNDGAVRLEAAQASGLSQVSPEAVPRDRRHARGLAPDRQPALRLSLLQPGLRAAHPVGRILPELAVSEVLAYRLGENEQTIDAELELDIREAPLRELLLRVPKGYLQHFLFVPAKTVEPEAQAHALAAHVGDIAARRRLGELAQGRRDRLVDDGGLGVAPIFPGEIAIPVAPLRIGRLQFAGLPREREIADGDTTRAPSSGLGRCRPRSPKV